MIEGRDGGGGERWTEEKRVIETGMVEGVCERETKRQQVDN